MSTRPWRRRRAIRPYKPRGFSLRVRDFASHIRIVRQWAPISISLVALGISGWAAYTSRLALSNEEYYKELNIMPALELRTHFGGGIRVSVTNQGAGQAVIEDLKVGKVDPSTYLYATYGDHMLSKAKECAKAEYPEYSSSVYFTPTTDRHYIRPGEEFDVFELSFRDGKDKQIAFTEAQAVLYNECVDNANIQVCYCSMSGKTCDVLSSRNFVDKDFLCPPKRRDR